MFRGRGKISIFLKSQLTSFWCGYCCIKHVKTASIASIRMQFYIHLVAILIKQIINEVFYYWVKKVVFEQLKLCHLEQIDFHRNRRLSCRKHSLKIVAKSVSPSRVCRTLKSIIQRNMRNIFLTSFSSM